MLQNANNDAGIVLHLQNEYKLSIYMVSYTVCCEIHNISKYQKLPIKHEQGD